MNEIMDLRCNGDAMQLRGRLGGMRLAEILHRVITVFDCFFNQLRRSTVES